MVGSSLELVRYIGIGWLEKARGLESEGWLVETKRKLTQLAAGGCGIGESATPDV
jgi:hypothetical protein